MFSRSKSVTSQLLTELSSKPLFLDILFLWTQFQTIIFRHSQRTQFQTGHFNAEKKLLDASFCTALVFPCVTSTTSGVDNQTDDDDDDDDEDDDEVEA